MTQGVGSWIFSLLLARFIGRDGGAAPALQGRLPGGHWLLAVACAFCAMLSSRAAFRMYRRDGSGGNSDSRKRGGAASPASARGGARSRRSSHGSANGGEGGGGDADGEAAGSNALGEGEMVELLHLSSLPSNRIG